jgi:hypothetical protein
VRYLRTNKFQIPVSQIIKFPSPFKYAEINYPTTPSFSVEDVEAVVVVVVVISDSVRACIGHH